MPLSSMTWTLSLLTSHQGATFPTGGLPWLNSVMSLYVWSRMSFCCWSDILLGFCYSSKSDARRGRCNGVGFTHLVRVFVQTNFVTGIPHGCHLVRKRLEGMTGYEPGASDVVLVEQLEQSRSSHFSCKHALHRETKPSQTVEVYKWTRSRDITRGVLSSVRPEPRDRQCFRYKGGEYR